MPDPTAPRPQDIPDEMVRAATGGYLGLEARRVIANVWPEIERRVREQVVAGIDELIERGYPQPVTAGLLAARDVARGESR